MADGRIIIDTEIDNSGVEEGLKKTVKSAKSRAATLAAEYKKQGMSASEAFKKAWSEIERDSDEKSKESANNWNNNLGSKLGDLASSALATTAKVTAAAVTAASGAVAALATLSIKQYAEYEQLVGGVETLFKDSSDIVMKYADGAYQAAGLSANEYMDTITGFAASLLQGLGGDTEKAAEIGNRAVTDMADNANKMGTAMESIQNAYQGFAKQNYTMLDNLKLGYGGTKEEMQRLLVDAGKLSGMEYSIGNFNDIIEAIHVVQTELGITGTTALEAATTIEGSFNSMKSAWINVLTGMADSEVDFDTLINNLVNSVSTFGENVIPRIEIAIQGIGQLVEKLLPPIVARLPQLITDVLPNLTSAGTKMIESLVSGLSQSMPELISGAVQIIGVLADGIIQVAPLLLEAGLQLIVTLGQGLASGLPQMIPTIVDLVISLCDMIIDNLPLIIDVAIDIIMALIEGLVTALPTLIQEVPRIINSFSSAIYEKLPDILKAGIDILLMLIKGLIDSIPILVANIPAIIMAIVNVFTLYNWWNIGKNLIANIGQGIKSMATNLGGTAKGVVNNTVTLIKDVFESGLHVGRYFIRLISNGISSFLSNIVSNAKGLGTSVLNAIKGVFNLNASEIGSNLIKGIWNGISNMSGWIINLIGGFASSVIKSIKGFFGIHSPSRVMRDLIGTNIVKGIGVGIDVETPNLEKDIDANMSDLVAKMKGTVDYEIAMTTARVISHNNSLSGGVEIDNTISKEKPVTVVAKFIVDGKEFTQTVVAPNQDVLNEYYEGRLP